MRRRHVWLFLALALAACSSQDRTRLAVTVYSDLSIPLEIDTLRIEVQGPSGVRQQVDYALATQSTPGKVTLPVQTILVPQGKKDDAFTIIASGFKDRSPVITRTARLSFISGEARELIIFLNRDCYQRTCVGDKTCIAGECVANTVNSRELPTYTTNVTGKSASPDASSSNRDAASGETGAVDGQAEVGVTGDARLLADKASDGHHEEAGTAQDAPDMPFDLAADTSIPLTDAALPAPDSASTRLPDSGPVVVGPDAAWSDTRPAVDTAGPTDSALASDTPVLAPDAPVVSPDAPLDVPCPPGCYPGARRCNGPKEIQTCGTLPNGCNTWGSDRSCGIRQMCTGDAPSATCTCNASGSSKCPLAGNTTGNFCEGTQILQSCMRDGDGCYYLATPVTCQASKPCTGSDGFASCSCGAVTAPCASTEGTFCNASKTQVFSCANDPGTGCMVTNPGPTCPTGKPCAQTGLAAACTCPAVDACDSANEKDRSYCSGNSVITCSADANDCQQASSLDCLGKTCRESSSSASCECTHSACLDGDGNPFTNQTCNQNEVLTCAIVDSCPTVTPSTCTAGTVCRASGGTAQCLTTMGWPTDQGASETRSNTTLIGHRMTAPISGRLAKIGVIMRSVPSSELTYVQMGVYSNGYLLTDAEGTVSVGPNEFSPSTTTQLTAGSVYWVVAIFSNNSASTAAGMAGGTRWSGSHNYGNDLPPQLTFSPLTAGYQSNYYLLVSP